MEELHKMVHIIGFVVAWVKSLGQTEKRPRIVPEVFNVKYSRWLRNFILLYVVIQASSRRSANKCRIGWNVMEINVYYFNIYCTVNSRYAQTLANSGPCANQTNPLQVIINIIFLPQTTWTPDNSNLPQFPLKVLVIRSQLHNSFPSQEPHSQVHQLQRSWRTK